MKIPKELRKRIKRYLREKDIAINAYDIKKLFTNSYDLNQSIILLETLYNEEKVIKRIAINDDIKYAYFYSKKKKLRGMKE